MMSVRNHTTSIYNEVLDSRARLAHHPSAYKIPWLENGIMIYYSII